MDRIHLEDIVVGSVLESTARLITAHDIAAFADLTGDRNPLHGDPAAVAEGSPYDAPIAHGLLVTSLSSGQATAADEWALGIYLEESRTFRRPSTPATRSARSRGSPTCVARVRAPIEAS